MGAGVSVLTHENNDEASSSSSSSRSTGLGDIPESCISYVLMKLDPPDICALARVNKTFQRASSADFVWQAKLPSTYHFLLHTILLSPNYQDMAMKHIYATLCQPNLIHGGTKEVWLDKCSGKVCLFLSSKSLKITGIDDRRYWANLPTEESRFQSIAYLQQMWWVEVVGEIEFEFPTGIYGLFFRLQLGKPTKRLGRHNCNLAQVHGWDIKPVRFQLSTSDGQNALHECYLNGPGEWAHYHVGNFIVESPNRPIKIKFSLAQIDCTHTKGGLSVDGAFICPSEFAKGLKMKSIKSS